MPPMKVKIKVENLDRAIECEVGRDLRSALLEHGIEIYRGADKYLNCNGLGACRTCQIQVVEGAEGVSEPDIFEKYSPVKIIRPATGCRLACQTRVYQDVTIRTLASSTSRRAPRLSRPPRGPRRRWISSATSIASSRGISRPPCG